VDTCLSRTRKYGAASFALLALLLPQLAASGTTARTQRESAVVEGVNHMRAEHDLPPLKVDLRLVRAARAHNGAIVSSGVFEHGTFWRWIEAAGVKGGQLGETLGWSAPAGGSEPRIVAAWMKSPEHRAILLDRDYEDVGVGVYVGTFNGHANALVVTADFHGPA
jgi:uncharacterized protein YkwD